MKRKHLVAVVVAAALLVIIGAIVNRSRSSGWKSAVVANGGKVLPDFPINDVAVVEITGKDGTVTLARKDGDWRVTQRYNYPANYTTLKEFMVKLQDLKAAQTVQIGPSQYGRLELADPDKDKDKDKGAGTKVTFKDASGKDLGYIILGKEHKKESDNAPGPMGMMGGGSWPDGRYLRVPSMEQVVLVSETFSSIQDDPSRWVEKEFFKIGDVQTASLSEGGKVLWRVSRKTKSDPLKLEGDIPAGKEVDTSKLSSIKSAFSWASFTDVADPSLSPEKTGMDKPKVYVARDFDGVVTTVRIGKEVDGKYYLQAEVAYKGPTERTPAKDEKEKDKKKKDEEFAKKLEEKVKKAQTTNKRLKGWTYLVSKYTVDSVLKKRDELLKDKPKPEEKKGKGTASAAKTKTTAKPATSKTTSAGKTTAVKATTTKTQAKPAAKPAAKTPAKTPAKPAPAKP